ncbi:MAG: DegT/DnrJ/EryC1/StrS family aminotransferase [Sphingomonadaceae bacterium]|nr:DegT/DnrJ/EryC1/StrS family aminotransferase [Sphingomonadaceae bacterium]
MSGRYLSLYYGSLDARRAAVLLGGWLTAPFALRRRREAALAHEVRAHLGDATADVFAYASARGALAAVLRAAGIGPGDEVLLSAFTCLAVPTAVLAAGGEPRYVDIDPETMNVPAEKLIEAIGPKVRAVVVQHTMGSVAEVDEIVAACRARGILVVEDCALALGSTDAGRPVGSRADAAIFSMELSKTLSTGWGGVLAVRHAPVAEAVAAQRIALPRRSCFAAARDTLQIIVTGAAYQRQLFFIGRYLVALGFRLGLFRGSTPAAEIDGRPAADFMAPLGKAQLMLAAHQWRRLPSVASASAANMGALRSALEAAGLATLGAPRAGDTAVSPRISFVADDRDRTIAWFAREGVEVGTWFDGPLTPVPTTAAFAFDAAQFPQAAALARRVVNLPAHVGVDAADRARLTRLIARFARERREPEAARSISSPSGLDTGGAKHVPPVA